MDEIFFKYGKERSYMKHGIHLSGRFSLLWLLVLAAVLYTGVRLIKKAVREDGEAIEVFAEAQEQNYQPSNKSFLDLLK